MPLLERGYKAAAKTEIERKVRELEDKDAIAQKKVDVSESAAIVSTNIEFAQRIKLITGQEAERYRKRLQAVKEAQELLRTQTGRAVDGFSNPQEQGAHFYSLEEVQADIARHRAEEKAPESAPPRQEKVSGDHEERQAPH